MAVYDLEEQDKLDDLKAWWTQWGNLITGVIVAVCLGGAGVQGWRWWKQSETEQAGVLYAAVNAAVRANDVLKAKEAMARLSDKYAGTGYAPRGALMMAALLYENADKPGAKAQLAFVLEKSSEDELRQIARLRLAAIQLDEKQYDEALRTLDAKHDESFAGVYADLRGDILAAAGRTAEARTAYQAALARLDARSPYRNFVQVKLDAVGGPAGPLVGAAVPAASPAAPAKDPAAPAAPAATPTPAAPAAPATTK
jgi:predicted negative regulator of RcsB-dependent stress response